MRKKYKTLISVTPNWISSGIFHYLDSLDVPWKSLNIADSLDLDYYGNRSGEKLISPLIEKLLSSETLSNTDMQALANVIFVKHGKNWDELWKTLNYEYNPIENYNMEEKHTGTDTHTYEPDNYKETITHTYEPDDYKETVTQKPTNWQTETTGLKADNASESQTQYYGFGSTDAVPVQDVTTDVKNKQTVTNSGTFATETTREGKETNTDETTREGTETNTTEYDTTLTRTGNIGTLTTQQMVQQQRDLWYFKIFDVVFKDVDNILTLSIY